MSDDFKNAHPVLSTIIASKIPNSKWKMVTYAVLIAKATGGTAALLNQLVALVTAREQRSDEFRYVKLKLTSQDALVFFREIDTINSCTGICRS